MMMLEDLLTIPRVDGPSIADTMNPLRDGEALLESQITQIRFSTLESVAGILFEFRTSLQLIEANTGVLVARGIREFTWSSERRERQLTAWSVIGSKPWRQGNLNFLEMSLYPNAHLKLVVEECAFYYVSVEGLEAAPPDYSLGYSQVQSKIANWHSSFDTIVAAYFNSGT